MNLAKTLFTLFSIICFTILSSNAYCENKQGEETNNITQVTSVQKQVYIKPFNPDSDDYFGSSIAVFGDTIVVGAPNEASGIPGVNASDGSDNTLTSGAVYVYVRDNGDTWTQQAYIKPEHINNINGQFGKSVAFDGYTLVVGAPGDDRDATGINPLGTSTNSPGSGAVYVYHRNGTQWILDAYIKPSDTQTGGNFGYSVSLKDNYLIVGAPFQHNGNFVQTGAAYVFKRVGNPWHQEAILYASNPDADDLFGFSVGIDNFNAVVGAIGEAGDNSTQSDNSLPLAGAAYIYERVNTTWSQVKYLKLTFPDANDRMGYAVSVVNQTIAVGIPLEDADETNPNDNAGLVLMYQRINGTWTRTDILSENNSSFSLHYGTAIDMIQDKIIIGARDYFANFSDEQGAAYEYTNVAGTWTLQNRYTSFNADPFDFYGTAVGLSDTTIAVGAFLEDSDSAITSLGHPSNPENNNNLINSGAAYAYFTAKVVFKDGFEQ